MRNGAQLKHTHYLRAQKLRVSWRTGLPGLRVSATSRERSVYKGTDTQAQPFVRSEGFP